MNQRRRHDWTREKLDELAELVEAGRPYSEIADHFDASVGAVSWQALRLGLIGPRSKSAQQQTGSYSRSGRIVRYFTPEEDELLLELEAQGKSTSEIARRLRRRHNSIIGRLATLARRDALNEEEE